MEKDTYGDVVDFGAAETAGQNGSDELAHAIVATVRTPMAVLTGDFRVFRVNSAFTSTFGLDLEDVLGKPIFEAGSGQLDLPDLRALLEKVLPERRELTDFELRADFGDDGPLILILNARRLERGEGPRPLILLSMENVTERYRLGAEANRYRIELERSNRELEDFAHAASHDLQEPLRKIRTYAERLPGLLDPASLDERATRYLVRLSEAAERMQTRIEDLLQMARVGRTAAVHRRTDLNQVVADVVEDMEIAVSDHGAMLDVGELPEIDADQAQMRMLFQNLISNALKFRRPGTSPVVRIRSETAADGESVRVVVEDEGIGFEQQFAERIFGPFQRLHSRNEYEGSGVGLSLCRRIIEHHDGSIRAEGRPGEGARFELTLPARQLEEARWGNSGS